MPPVLRGALCRFRRGPDPGCARRGAGGQLQTPATMSSTRMWNAACTSPASAFPARPGRSACPSACRDRGAAFRTMPAARDGGSSAPVIDLETPQYSPKPDPRNARGRAAMSDVLDQSLRSIFAENSAFYARRGFERPRRLGARHRRSSSSTWPMAGRGRAAPSPAAAWTASFPPTGRCSTPAAPGACRSSSPPRPMT